MSCLDVVAKERKFTHGPPEIHVCRGAPLNAKSILGPNSAKSTTGTRYGVTGLFWESSFLFRGKAGKLQYETLRYHSENSQWLPSRKNDAKPAENRPTSYNQSRFERGISWHFGHLPPVVQSSRRSIVIVTAGLSPTLQY